jgi:hypothetical protein
MYKVEMTYGPNRGKLYYFRTWYGCKNWLIAQRQCYPHPENRTGGTATQTNIPPMQGESLSHWITSNRRETWTYIITVLTFED